MPVNLIPLLKRMSDGHFHSGQDMAAHFSVSRATIFNLLNEAEKYGVRIHAVRGKGYRLATPLAWLDPEAFTSEVEQLGLNYRLISAEIADSTNSWLMKEALAGAPHRTVAYADFQYGGRGRRGRNWEASLGGGLTFSVLWRFDRGISQLSGLSVVAGLALASAIRKVSGVPVQLKWPNDVLAGYRKLAGILVEVQGEMSGPAFAVIGIGLNERLSEQQRQEIDQAVVDLAELGVAAGRNELMVAILHALSNYMEIFEQNGMQAFINEWTAWHVHEGKSVVVRMPDGTVHTGIASGIDDNGNLLLSGTNGITRKFAAGEVSMRGAAS